MAERRSRAAKNFRRGYMEPVYTTAYGDALGPRIAGCCYRPTLYPPAKASLPRRRGDVSDGGRRPVRHAAETRGGIPVTPITPPPRLGQRERRERVMPQPVLLP